MKKYLPALYVGCFFIFISCQSANVIAAKTPQQQNKVPEVKSTKQEVSEYENAVEPKSPKPWWLDYSQMSTLIKDDQVLAVNKKTGEEKPLFKLNTDFTNNGDILLKITLTPIENLQIKKMQTRAGFPTGKNGGYVTSMGKVQLKDGGGIMTIKISNPRKTVTGYNLLALIIDYTYNSDNKGRLYYPSASAENNAVMSFEFSSIDLWDSRGDFSNLLSADRKDMESEGTQNLSTFIDHSDTGSVIVFNDGPVKYQIAKKGPIKFDIIQLNIPDWYSDGSKKEQYLGKTDLDTIILIDRAVIGRKYFFKRDSIYWKKLRDPDSNYPEALKKIAKNANQLNIGNVLVIPFDPVNFKSTDAGLEFTFNWTNVRDISTIDIRVKTFGNL